MLFPSILDLAELGYMGDLFFAAWTLDDSLVLFLPPLWRVNGCKQESLRKYLLLSNHRLNLFYAQHADLPATPPSTPPTTAHLRMLIILPNLRPAFPAHFVAWRLADKHHGRSTLDRRAGWRERFSFRGPVL